LLTVSYILDFDLQSLEPNRVKPLGHSIVLICIFEQAWICISKWWSKPFILPFPGSSEIYFLTFLLAAYMYVKLWNPQVSGPVKPGIIPCTFLYLNQNPQMHRNIQLFLKIHTIISSFTSPSPCSISILSQFCLDRFHCTYF